jgi:hypothetical protein
MAIKVSGTTVIDDNRNINAGIITATSLNVPPEVLTFSPADGATNVDSSSNIVITYNVNLKKGSGNITLRNSSGIGTVISTIDVTSSDVTISGGQVTIAPSTMPNSTDVYVVLDAGVLVSTGTSSKTTEINDYNFTTRDLALGDAFSGGYLICCASSTYWIVAPSSTEVTRNWDSRGDAVTTAQAQAACGDWFVPNCNQFKNPGCLCRNYWDSYSSNYYWTDSQSSATQAYIIRLPDGADTPEGKSNTHKVRAFRTLSY